MRSVFFIFIIFPFIFRAQDIHRNLSETKWNGPDLLYPGQDPMVFKHARVNPYGNFLELKYDSTFNYYNVQARATDCYFYYTGKYLYSNWTQLILDFKTYSQHGVVCDNQNKKFQPNELKRDFFVKQFKDTLILYKGFGQPTDFVTDNDSVLSELDEQILNKICSNYEEKTTNEICIVSIEGDVKPYQTLKEYTIDLANYWGIGKKEKNNGVVIAFSTQMKEIRISVGYWLVDELTDQDCKWIINRVILPEFKKGNYFEGLKAGLNKIFDELK